MVGMRFCPRIRSLHRQRIYCADPARDHGAFEPVLKRGRRAVSFRLIAEQWDRIGQFYAAFPAGHATASAALQRLNRFQASNRFYAANGVTQEPLAKRVIGRVFPAGGGGARDGQRAGCSIRRMAVTAPGKPATRGFMEPACRL